MNIRSNPAALPLSALIVASCVGLSAEAATLVKGKIYASEATMDSPIFYYENSRAEETGKLISKTTYSELSGKPAVEEELTYEAGKLKKYTYNQHQTEEHGTIEVQDGKVHYAFDDAKGNHTGKDPWEENMLLPDMLEGRINEAWPLLSAGEETKFRFLILEKQDNYGFKIFKAGDTTYNGKPAVDLTMKASGFFVALAAPAFKITVEKEAPHRILQTVGRLPVRIPKRVPPQGRGDLKALDGVLVLAHVDAPTASSPADSAGASSGAGAGAPSPAGAASGLAVPAPRAGAKP